MFDLATASARVTLRPAATAAAAAGAVTRDRRRGHGRAVTRDRRRGHGRFMLGVSPTVFLLALAQRFALGAICWDPGPGRDSPRTCAAVSRLVVLVVHGSGAHADVTRDRRRGHGRDAGEDAPEKIPFDSPRTCGGESRCSGCGADILAAVRP